MVGWANEITRKDMEEIYELTYKYQMLKQEQQYGDQGLPQTLPDRAYMELAKISAELSNKLDDSYYRMVSVYESWVDHHVGLAEEDVAVDLHNAIEEDLISAKSYDDFLKYVSEEDLRDIIAKEADAYIQVLKNYGELTPEQLAYYGGLDFSNMTLAELQAVPFVQEDRGLFKDVLTDIINGDYALEDDDEMRNELMEQYCADTALGGAVEMLDLLQTQWQPLPEGLDRDITLFQQALTTAHNNGSMAEYLITHQGQIDHGAVEFLNELSAGPHVEEWNREVEQVLGYQVGSRSTPVQEWYNVSHLVRAIQMLAAA